MTTVVLHVSRRTNCVLCYDASGECVARVTFDCGTDAELSRRMAVAFSSSYRQQATQDKEIPSEPTCPQ